MTLQTKSFTMTSGRSVQIKIIDNAAPIRFYVESGSFTYDHKIATQNISIGTAVATGVVTAPGGAWGSEIKIDCTGDGILHIAYMG